MKKLTTLFLAMLMLVTIVATQLPVCFAQQTAGAELTLIVYGRPSCLNTTYTLQDIASSQEVLSKNVKIVFQDIDKNSDETVQAFAKKINCSKITFLSDPTGKAAETMWALLNGETSVTLPVTAYFDAQNKALKVETGYKSPNEILDNLNALQASQATQQPTATPTQPATQPTEQPTQPATQPTEKPTESPTQPTQQPTTPPAPHSSVFTTTVTPAQYRQDGKITQTCSSCGATAATVIPAIKTIKLSKSKFAYDGTQIKPTVTVKDTAGKVLSQGTDYTVKYSKGRTEFGTYTVRVTFKGNYAGTKKLHFKIVLGQVKDLQATAGQNTAKLTWSPVKGATNYIVYLSASKDGPFKESFTTHGPAATVMRLSTGKTYYFRVSAVAKLDSGEYKGSMSAIRAATAL